jgi:hypothetical protein
MEKDPPGKPEEALLLIFRPVEKDRLSLLSNSASSISLYPSAGYLIYAFEFNLWRKTKSDIMKFDTQTMGFQLSAKIHRNLTAKRKKNVGGSQKIRMPLRLSGYLRALGGGAGGKSGQSKRRSGTSFLAGNPLSQDEPVSGYGSLHSAAYPPVVSRGGQGGRGVSARVLG